MPRSVGNRYWITPATRRIIEDDPGLAPELHTAMNRITALHRSHPNLPQKWHMEILHGEYELYVYSQWGRECVELRRVKDKRPTAKCGLFLEVGKLDLLDVGISAPLTLTSAQLKFSDGTVDEYMGFAVFEKGAVSIESPRTPSTFICDDEGVVVDHWGLDENDVLTEGESLVVTVNACDR